MDTHAELNAYAEYDLPEPVKRVTAPGCLEQYLESKGITRDTPLNTIKETFVVGCSNCHNVAEFMEGTNTPGYVGACATALLRREAPETSSAY